jgi:hypothetical protein
MLMRRMGIEALYRRPRTTKPEPGHKIYPYLLRGMEITRPMEAAFCVGTLEDALARHGKPEIFNIDQGSQFTGTAFTGVLADNGIAISMDGKGVCATTCSSSGCGAASNMRRYICGPTTPSVRHGGRADGVVRQAGPEQIYLMLRAQSSIVSVSFPPSFSSRVTWVSTRFWS